MSDALTLEAVTLRYGQRTILDAMTLAVGPGEIVSLLGRSGSGKTSILRMLLGFEVPQAGVVRIDGEVATAGGRLHVLPEYRGLAVVFQDMALWPHLDLLAQLEFGLEAKAISREERRTRSLDMLAQVGLAGREHSYPHQLSGGEQRRVALARALVMRPRAILFDEALGNLDIVLRAELLKLIREQLERYQLAALFITHEPRDAAVLGGRVAVLEEGRIVRAGTLKELCTNPATAFIARMATDLANV